ncbi:MAG TPA: thioredoxin domain-containing protein [Acidobacteriota bacterium]|nr:thioredoxin domain-containing protein [Acidobacteriota bacterium]
MKRVRWFFLALGLLASAIVGQEAKQEENAASRPQANRLIDEGSPYLRQHAYNPVDWYPWGDEAFETARREGKPVFLSVGYSTCHWCHVMRRESFSNPSIAALLNRHFVAVKVDREERPDVDRVYMTFLQSATGGGGWPMSVFLTPEAKPFFGGTYYPPQDRGGLPGFARVLERVVEEWQSNRDKILKSADAITRSLRQATRLQADPEWTLQAGLLDTAYQHYRASFDEQHGGFAGPPKFPRPSDFGFLLRRHLAGSDQQEALNMALTTLRSMARGGIYDHLGGGFHRYSTDARWFLPHFEKMLYDQAQLAQAYLDAYQVSRDPLMAETARGTLDYVLSRMRSPQGAFYSAEDADSPVPGNPDEESEGAFYLWKLSEIEEVVGEEGAALFAAAYGVQADGNVESDPSGEFGNRNVLYRALDDSALAGRFSISPGQAEQRLARYRARLLGRRAERPRPHRDEKILTAWNGLMISALCRAHQVLGEERYLEAARRAADFIERELYDSSSRNLKRRHLEGDSAIPGMLDDYAYLAQGLIDLYETELDDGRLLWALELTEAQMARFQDPQQGGFFNAPQSGQRLLFRLKEEYDGAVPSGNSVAASNLLRLAEMSGREDLRQAALSTMRTFHRILSRAPQAMPRMLASIGFHLRPVRQVIIAGRREDPKVKAMLRAVHEDFHPDQILFLADGGRAHQVFSKTQEGLEGKKPRQGQATAYVCRNFVCKLPTDDIEQLKKLLEEDQPASDEDDGSAPGGER